MIKRGAELKAKEINAAGGVNGKTFTIILKMTPALIKRQAGLQSGSRRTGASLQLLDTLIAPVH